MDGTCHRHERRCCAHLGTAARHASVEDHLLMAELLCSHRLDGTAHLRRSQQRVAKGLEATAREVSRRLHALSRQIVAWRQREAGYHYKRGLIAAGCATLQKTLPIFSCLAWCGLRTPMHGRNRWHAVPRRLNCTRTTVKRTTCGTALRVQQSGWASHRGFFRSDSART